MSGIRNRVKELRHVRASEIVPNGRNWRTHPDAQRDAMRGVLEEVGYVDALLVREMDDGRLQMIDGHLRRDLTPDDTVPVLVVDLDDAEADKVLATFDPLAAMAEVDQQLLGELLHDVETQSEAVQSMLEELAAENGVDVFETPEVVEDEAPIDRAMELQEKWGTSKGQLWVIEGKQTHRLLVGDSTQAADVERVMGGEKAFIMVTDPPYGVEYDPAWRQEAADKGLIGFSPSAMGEVQNDDRKDWTDAYKLFTGHVAYVWHAGRFTADIVANLHAAEFGIRSQVIWRKSSFAISRGHYHWQHEPCWYAVRKGGSSKWCGDRSQSTIWDIAHVKNETGHGTQKPVECMARPIRNHGDHDDHVYDPFVGSGTTIVAGDALGRRVFSIEIEPKYVAVILERMTALGAEPRLVED